MSIATPQTKIECLNAINSIIVEERIKICENFKESLQNYSTKLRGSFPSDLKESHSFKLEKLDFGQKIAKTFACNSLLATRPRSSLTQLCEHPYVGRFSTRLIPSIAVELSNCKEAIKELAPDEKKVLCKETHYFFKGIQYDNFRNAAIAFSQQQCDKWGVNMTLTDTLNNTSTEAEDIDKDLKLLRSTNETMGITNASLEAVKGANVSDRRLSLFHVNNENGYSKTTSLSSKSSAVIAGKPAVNNSSTIAALSGSVVGVVAFLGAGACWLFRKNFQKFSNHPEASYDNNNQYQTMNQSATRL